MRLDLNNQRTRRRDWHKLISRLYYAEYLEYPVWFTTDFAMMGKPWNKCPHPIIPRAHMTKAIIKQLTRYSRALKSVKLEPYCREVRDVGVVWFSNGKRGRMRGAIRQEYYDIISAKWRSAEWITVGCTWTTNAFPVIAVNPRVQTPWENHLVALIGQYVRADWTPPEIY